MSKVFVSREKPSGLKKKNADYSYRISDNHFSINRYDFDVYGKHLHIRGYSSGRRVGEMFIENYRSLPVYRMMEFLGEWFATDISRNRIFYDGMLEVYRATGGNIGLTYPILRSVDESD